MSIGRNTMIGAATDIAILGLGIIVSVILTRSFGPEQRGIYALLIISNVLLANIFHLNLGIACSTMLARERYSLGEVNTIVLMMALGLGAICIAVASTAYLLLRDSMFQDIPYVYLLVALLLTPTTIYQAYWNYMMMGLNRLVTMNKLNLLVNLGSASMMILVVGVLQGGLPGFLAVWSASALIGASASVFMARRLERFAWPPRRAVLRDLLSFGLRSHGANLAHQIFLRFDAYAVKALVSTTGLGFYSLATSLAEKLWLPLNAIQASSLSKITQLPKEESALLTAKVARTALVMMLSFALPFALVSPWLIPFMYGVEFSAAVFPLVILLGGALGFAVMLVLNNYILGQMERPGLLSVVSWLQLAVSVPLYLALVLSNGIIGAAIASSLTYLLATLVTLIVFMRDSGLSARMVLIPRRSDFDDYLRILKTALARLPGKARHADRT